MNQDELQQLYNIAWSIQPPSAIVELSRQTFTFKEVGDALGAAHQACEPDPHVTLQQFISTVIGLLLVQKGLNHPIQEEDDEIHPDDPILPF